MNHKVTTYFTNAKLFYKKMTERHRHPVTQQFIYQSYFVGIFAKTAFRNSQHFATDGMFARSSGE